MSTAGDARPVGAGAGVGAGWTFAGEAVSRGAGTVTHVEGSSFCLSSDVGDIAPGHAQGLFARDVRLLSTWQVRLDGRGLEPLAVIDDLPFRGTFLCRLPGLAGIGDPGVVVERARSVSGGMSEDLCVRNDGPRHRRISLEVWADADLADVFEVKESRVRRRPARRVVETGGSVRIGDSTHFVTVSAPGAAVVCEARGGQLVSTEAAPARLRWELDLPPRNSWTVRLEVTAELDGQVLGHAHSDAAGRLRTWTEAAPVLAGGSAALRAVLQTSREDLGALRIADPAHPDEVAVAAGAPWFMALFGRDSLLTSYMALPVDPRLASSTLRVLARNQGVKTDAQTEEQPGRILHELRFAEDADVPVASGQAYYGSVDATPLFVVVLGELRRWGLGEDAVRELLPAADRALSWCADYGDRDGDGFIEYLRSSEGGLPHQGWRDSAEAITFVDGTVAEPPMALAEVQGYWYAALRARAGIARSLGDDGRRWDDAAEQLRRRFDEAFWVASADCYAIALDGSKRQVDGVTSSIGHLLWSGIVPPARAASLARLLVSPQLFSGWGLRTLAADMGAYDPLGYHCGGVWPHDTALGAAGLMRYGFVEEARQLATALVQAGAALGGRLPELICGFDRATYPLPVVYPAACSPQAWASAAPVLALWTLLRFDVDVPAGSVWFAPALPPAWQPLELSRVPLAGTRVRVRVDSEGRGTVDGLPSHLTLHDGVPATGG